MGMPTWWGERRYGLFVHSNLATVPAWSPIGQYADWYQSHVGEDVADVILHPRPMVEVLAHHRDRWGHIDHFDDFLPLLTFDRFDPEEWARLAVDAGMGYTVFVSKHHDGWCWWDAPNTDRTLLRGGPRRNVLAEFAAACERNDLTFGTYYSLLDWGDPRYPSEQYVTEVLHPHVRDLVERYGSRVLWGDGHWGHGPAHWRSGELLRQMWGLDPELVVNDRWWASDDDGPAGSPPPVRTYEYDAPDGIVDTPWELCRGIGASFCHNRAERAEHHMTGFDIIALLTEVVAKGGNLLLNVGPSLDGTIPDLQAGPLRDAGRWVTQHHELVNSSSPWTTWGDEHVRYLVVDGILHAVDLSGRGHFAALDTAVTRVTAVDRISHPIGDGSDRPLDIRFRQDDTGLHLDLPRTTGSRAPRNDHVAAVRVYRLTTAVIERPVELFDPEPRRPVELAPLLADVSPGDIVQLGDGTYRGPVDVPAGVVLRGLGGGRTVIDGSGGTAVTLHRNSRLEHLSVTGGPERIAWFPAATVTIAGPFATVLGCAVDGHIVVGAHDGLVRATTACGVVAEGVDRLTVSRCELRGMRWDVGIQLTGGGDHEIDSCELHDHLCAVRATETTGTIVRGSNISARWWGIHLERTERAHVHGNFIDHTMRAIDIDGGTQALIDGNAVCDGDSGCIVEWGASGCQVSGNRWERCRIGVLAWEATGLHQQDNRAIDLHEPEHATQFGP
jgi:alpha-L-fucosidase